MQATVEQLQQILILSKLDQNQLAQLQLHAVIKSYGRGEIIFHEGDRLPAQLFAVLSGRIEVKKMASTGKETILRTRHLHYRINLLANHCTSIKTLRKPRLIGYISNPYLIFLYRS